MWEEIEHVPAGIPGLDLITYGGLTRDRLTLVSGTAGSGKTVFANQFLAVGIRDANEPGVLVTFEERPEAIRRNVRSFGWDLAAWEEAGKWRFVDASPRHEVETVLTGGSYDLQPRHGDRGTTGRCRRAPLTSSSFRRRPKAPARPGASSSGTWRPGAATS